MATATKKNKQLPDKYERGFMRKLDGRTEVCQRLVAAYETIVEEAGGEGSLAHTKLALIERFVFLEATVQTWELELAQNPTASPELLSRWIQAVNSLQGLAKIIGIERQTKKVVDLKAYVSERGRT